LAHPSATVGFLHHFLNINNRLRFWHRPGFLRGMNTLHKMFSRVHSRYTRSRYAEELSSYSQWLLERECSFRYSQRQVFRVRRSLEAFGLPPFRTWTEAELDQAFHRRKHRLWYRHARHSFALFLQSVGRRVPRQKQ